MHSCMRNLVIAAACSFLFQTASGLAQTSIDGDVRGVTGKALGAAEIRAELQGKRAPAAVARPDAAGHFILKNLAAGTYKVSAVSGGKVLSTALIQTRAGKAAMVHLGSSPTTVASGKQPVRKGKKKFIWVPSDTGSHLGGKYVEVTDDGTAEPGSQNLIKGSGETVRQYQTRQSSSNSSGGSR